MKNRLRYSERNNSCGDSTCDDEHGDWRPRWIPVRGGFLCDPFGGEVVTRDGVAYWATGGEEHLLDLTADARAEADRRNGLSDFF